MGAFKGCSKLTSIELSSFNTEKEAFYAYRRIWQFNDNKTVMVRDKQPYLVKLADKSTFDDLMKIVKTQNRKRKPPRPPLFNDENLDFHWDLIFELERNNKYVQEVRKREREFVELYRKYQKEAEALENEE